MTEQPTIPTDMIAETENYAIWRSQEPDGETVHHVEINNVTVHFFNEEWQEFLQLIEALSNEHSVPKPASKPGKSKK